MLHTSDLPDCVYTVQPTYVYPQSPTPTHTLYLSNLDDQKFLRFSIKYLYLYRNAVCSEKLKSSLSRVLVDYYPLAGRLKLSSGEHGHEKLEVDCNGEGALFVEAFMDFTTEDFLQGSRTPNWSWRKLLYRVESQSFLSCPPLVVQVTKLRCGGMFLCIAINHCLADGVGSSQFLHAWAHFTTKPHSNHPPVIPQHSRLILRPRSPPKPTTLHSLPEFKINTTTATNTQQIMNLDIRRFLLSQPLVPTSTTFTSSLILRLKSLCTPSLKCTSFEALAAHVWRAWARSLGLPHSLPLKLLFSVNARSCLSPKLPLGFYGNAFVLGCAQCDVGRLVKANLHNGVRLVQEAKAAVDDERVRSIIDVLEENQSLPDLSATLAITKIQTL